MHTQYHVEQLLLEVFEFVRLQFALNPSLRPALSASNAAAAIPNNTTTEDLLTSLENANEQWESVEPEETAPVWCRERHDVYVRKVSGEITFVLPLHVASYIERF